MSRSQDSAPIHPAQRFRAPSHIAAGVPLKGLLDRTAIALIGDSFSAVAAGFDVAVFRRAALRGLEPLGLMQRAGHIADCLAKQLPQDFDATALLLIRSLGPSLRTVAGNGLAPFFYLPHSFLIARHGLDHLDSALLAMHALTQRFTAEFAIRPFLIAHQDACLRRLTSWARDPDVHVRRLVSEGTRPRLPWGQRLPALQRDPAPVLPLLELLKDDPELYVRRSVANHLGDIAKDHPTVAFALCRHWVDEAKGLAPEAAAHRRWLIRHALRLPAKHRVAAALAIRRMAAR